MRPTARLETRNFHIQRPATDRRPATPSSSTKSKLRLRRCLLPPQRKGAACFAQPGRASSLLESFAPQKRKQKIMGNALPKPKDGTAQGVAKVRHHESLFPPERRLYHDPYAYAMFPGSIVQQWMGAKMIEDLYRWMGMAGISEMISIRTRWLDDRILDTVRKDDERERAKQLIILGAGYDTRGFRLDLWRSDEDFVVWEVDQPEVQEKKLANLRWLARKDANGDAVADRMDSRKVRFLPVDFNADDLRRKIEASEGFRPAARSVATLEGVTQYIPKESTADSLKKLRSVVAAGSTLLVTYVDQRLFGTDESLPAASKRVMDMAARFGEPWISAWSQEGFESFLKDCGYRVLSDTGPEDYNGTYLKSVDRMLDEQDVWVMERFVVAEAI